MTTNNVAERELQGIIARKLTTAETGREFSPENVRAACGDKSLLADAKNKIIDKEVLLQVLTDFDINVATQRSMFDHLNSQGYTFAREVVIDDSAPAASPIVRQKWWTGKSIASFAVLVAISIVLILAMLPAKFSKQGTRAATTRSKQATASRQTPPAPAAPAPTPPAATPAPASPAAPTNVQILPPVSVTGLQAANDHINRVEIELHNNLPIIYTRLGDLERKDVEQDRQITSVSARSRIAMRTTNTRRPCKTIPGKDGIVYNYCG